MTRASLAGWSLASGFLLLAFFSGRAAIRDGVDLLPDPADAITTVHVTPAIGLLHGRVTTTDGVVHEGRLRFGGDEEALWSHYFNGRKLDLDRPFMVRFGDIARIDAERRTLAVTLRSGDVVTLDRFEADDFADGIRVWDDDGVVDLGEWSVRSVEFLPAPDGMTGPAPLRGTVRTSAGEFSGLLQWDREESFGTDRLEGAAADGEPVGVPFASVGAIVRGSRDDFRAVLIDGRELEMSAVAGSAPHRGIYVDDVRYGRVLVSWDAVEMVEFTDQADVSAPLAGFGDFTGGSPLEGAVTTRSGERLVGLLVYDLDERRTIETLDAPWAGVDYTIPFSLVSSIELPPEHAEAGAPARVALRTGEVLRLEAAGDLAPGNAGLLVMTPDGGDTRFVAWSDVARLEFEGASPGA